MKNIFHLTILGLLFTFSAFAEQQLLGRPLNSKQIRNFDSWSSVELKLSKDLNLKDIFDSGLRPYHFPFMETTLLEAKHFSVRVKVEGVDLYPKLPVEYTNIKVFDDGSIANLEFTSPPLSYEQVKSLYTPWLSLSDRSIEDLDNFLVAVEKNPSFWRSQSKDPMVKNGCSVVWRPFAHDSSSQIPAFVTLLPTYGSSLPLRIRLGFRMSRDKPRSKKTYYNIPVPAPLGYEHISMEAPSNFGPDAPNPELVDLSINSVVKEQFEKESLKEKISTRPTIDVNDEAKPNDYRLIGILIALIVAGLLYKIFRR